MTLRGDIELIFADWVFWYRTGSLREWRTWDSQVANARETFRQSWSFLCLETALLRTALSAAIDVLSSPRHSHLRGMRHATRDTRCKNT
jgi:hypothetical protein